MFGPCPSLFACLGSGDAVSSSHAPGVWLLREGLWLLVLHAGSGPQDVARGEVVWAAGFLPCCLGDTVLVRFRLFSPWELVTSCVFLVMQNDWQTQPGSFIPIDWFVP